MKVSMLKRPVIMLVLVNVLAFVLLYSYRMPPSANTLLIGASILTLSAATYLMISRNHLGDEYLFLIVSMLVTIGVAMLCRIKYALGIAQVGWYLIGICVFYAAYAAMRYVGLWRRLKWAYAGMSALLFAATLAFGVTINGSRNWIILGGHSFQPSEVIKILFVFFIACCYGQPKTERRGKISVKYIVTGVTYVFMLFLIMQREWGMTLLFFATYLVLTYIYENDKLLLLGNVLLTSVVGLVGYHALWHIRIRIASWINPWADISNTGYQITQSLFAIASGGFFGKGIGLGNPEFIPEVHSDFIFSAICEEMGILGGVAVILLYFIFVYRGVKIALMLPEGFEKCVAVGLTVLFGIQTFMILGGVVKLIPLTGITLPFVSYGGSSLVTSFVSLGILQAISAKRRLAGD